MRLDISVLVDDDDHDGFAPKRWRAVARNQDPERICVPFGKHRDTPLIEVAQTSEGVAYLQWVLNLAGGSGAAAQFAEDYAEAIRAAVQYATKALSNDAPPVTVTPHQQAAVDHLYHQVMAGEPVVRLEGGAGYGKSYAVKALLLKLREQGVQSRACAVSYVAAQVLARDLEPYGFNAETIARTLKLTKVFKNGAESYEATRDSLDAARALTSSGNLLAVDECSMVNDPTARMLIDAVDGGTLLLVGDRYQLPPVGQDSVSVCCDTPYPATLTEPMRYSKESMLFALEQAARFQPERIPEVAYNPFSEGEIVRVPSSDALIERFVSNYRNDPESSHRILLFLRQDVTDANNAVRQQIYGPFADDIEPGERLMVLRTSDFPWVKNAKLGETKRHYSGEVLTVEDRQLTEHLGLPCWLVHFKGRQEPVRCIFAVSESKADISRIGGAEYTAAVNAAFTEGRSTGNWETLKRLQSDFVSVAYCYATSIHRAQGQTADYSYTLPVPLMGVKGIMGRALLYVALTRARKQAVMRI